MEDANEETRVEGSGSGLDDDLYDGLVRDLRSREIAREEGRDEGQTVVVEPLPGGRGIVTGRKRSLERFREMTQHEVVDYRPVEVDCFPTDPAAVEAVVRPMLPRLSEARRKRGWPAAGPLTNAIEGLMGLAEVGMEKLGVPLEPQGEPGESAVRDDG